MSHVRLKFIKVSDQNDRILVLRRDGSEFVFDALKGDGTVLRFLTRYAVETVLKAPGVLSAIGDGYDPLVGELSSEIWQIEVLVRAIEQEEFNKETSIRAILSTVNVLCDTVGISPRSFQRSDVENAIDMMKELKLRWKALTVGDSFEIVLSEE